MLNTRELMFRLVTVERFQGANYLQTKPMSGHCYTHLEKGVCNIEI